jgi:hypothetical protein
MLVCKSGLSGPQSIRAANVDSCCRTSYTYSSTRNNIPLERKLNDGERPMDFTSSNAWRRTYSNAVAPMRRSGRDPRRRRFDRGMPCLARYPCVNGQRKTNHARPFVAKVDAASMPNSFAFLMNSVRKIENLSITEGINLASSRVPHRALARLLVFATGLSCKRYQRLANAHPIRGMVNRPRQDTLVFCSANVKSDCFR